MDVNQHNVFIKSELAGNKARAFMKTVMARIEKHIKENLSGKVLKARTGKLRSSVSTDVTTSGLTVSGGVYVGDSGKLGMIASIWEFTGRRAYIIRAQRRKALKIPTSKGGTRSSYIFRRQAYIPKESPRPFVSPAIDKATPFLLALHAKKYEDIFGPMKIDIKI